MLMLEMFLAAIEALAKVRSNANRTLQHSNASQGPVFPTLKERDLGWQRRCAQWLASEAGSLCAHGLRSCDWLVTLSSLGSHKRKPNDCAPPLAQRLFMRESSESCALAGARFEILELSL